ncbi:MAG TPA: hypothetical protein VN739_05130 [Nitrososphaerales archaeon]|nr:hypothetical protein [Nitrososphaerales archaeon]
MPTSQTAYLHVIRDDSFGRELFTNAMSSAFPNLLSPNRHHGLNTFDPYSQLAGKEKSLSPSMFVLDHFLSADRDHLPSGWYALTLLLFRHY